MDAEHCEALVSLDGGEPLVAVLGEAQVQAVQLLIDTEQISLYA